VVQKNQDDATFLLERAKRLDFDCYILPDPGTGEDTLYFIKPTDGRDGRPIRVYRLAYAPGLSTGPANQPEGLIPNLIEFTPTLTVSQQVSKVTVRGWDPRTKQPIAFTATAENLPAGQNTADGQSGPQVAESTLQGRQEVMVDAPVGSDQEARELAISLLRERAYEFITATGKVAGLPELRPGDNLEIYGLGRRFSGTYFVKRVEHTLNTSGFFTQFTGTADPSGGPVTMRTTPRARSTDKRYYGVVEALVVENEGDDEGPGQAEVPLVRRHHGHRLGPGQPAVCRQGGYGSVFVPEKGDEVLVAFVHGDMRFPIVLGGLYNGEDKPPTARTDGRDQKMIRTRHGHEVLLDDTESKAAVRITSAAGHVVELDDQGKAIRITAAEGGSVTVTAQGDITLKAPKVTVDSPSINLGGDAQPLALGNALLTAFNTHTHASAGSPPAPQLKPADVLAKKVKTS
jgi:phage baseplate assembly protein gpV